MLVCIICYIIGIGHESQVIIGYRIDWKKSIWCIPNMDFFQPIVANNNLRLLSQRKQFGFTLSAPFNGQNSLIQKNGQLYKSFPNICPSCISKIYLFFISFLSCRRCCIDVNKKHLAFRNVVSWLKRLIPLQFTEIETGSDNNTTGTDVNVKAAHQRS